MANEMYDVLERLKAIENPTEDQQAAIKSAEAMTTAPAPAEAVETTVTGDNVYTEYAPSEPADYAKLAGVPTLAVQTEPTNESVEAEEESITEAQSPAQKAAFQKMLDAKKGKTEDKDEDEDKEEVEESIDVHEDDAQEEEVISEGPTRKDFQMVADLIKNAEPAKKAELAQHHADVFAKQNPRFDKERFMAACGIEESVEADESILEYYDPNHVSDIIKKHEANGHEVEMDPYKDDEAGFTVTFKDGSRRHYHYTQKGTKVTSLEPVDAIVDPNAPKRERGRPKKEGIEEVEVDELTRQFESKLADLLPAEEVVTEATQINESVQLTQSIDDQGNESVNINAQGDHVDMVKQLLALSGMRSDGYKEYKPEEEHEEVGEELANSPDPKYADVDTQLNKQSGGLNGPKDKSALRGDSVKLHDSKELEESLLDLYKEYKG